MSVSRRKILGVGTYFSINLPSMESQDTQEESVTDNLESNQLNNKIHIIDDNEAILNLVSETLELKGKANIYPCFKPSVDTCKAGT